MKAYEELARLQVKWIGARSGEPNLHRIHALILRELRMANDGIFNVTDGLKAEMHGELVLCAAQSSKPASIQY